MFRKMWPVAWVVLLCACAQPVDYQRPELPVPAHWAPESNPTGNEEAVKTHWSTYFVDPRLHVLIETALKNNRDLRIATARVAEARAQYGVVGADRFPAINLAGSGSIGSTPADLSGTGTVINGQRYDLALTNVSYEVDFWGRVASLTEAARNSYLASEEARHAFQLSLVSEVATSYFTLLQFQELLDFSSAAVLSRENSLSVVGKGRDAGATYDFEYLQAQSALEGARSEHASLIQQRNTAQNKLNYLVGELPQVLPEGRDLEHQGADAVLMAGLPGEVLLARPDVVAAEQRLRAAHANIEAARAAFFPKVALSASLGVASIGLSSLFNGMAWSFQPSIALPLFDGGRLESGRDLVEARKVVAVAEYEKTIQLAFREVADLLSARSTLAAQMRSAQINAQAQQRRLDMVRARHQVGLISVLDVMDGERSLVSAQQTLVQLRRAQLETAAQLYKALGGGT